MSFKKVVKLSSFLVLAGILVSGCSGKNGNNGVPGINGTNGTAGLSTGTLSGTVVNSATQKPVANATVALNPAVASNVSTDTNGNFSFSNIPIGPYQVIVSASGYNQLTSGLIAVAAGMTATTTLSLVQGPQQAPLITWPSNYYVDSLDVGLYNVGYGATVSVSANVSDPNYSASALTYTWTVQSYPQYGRGTYPNETQIAGANTASVTFTTDPILTQLTPQTGRDNVMPIAPYEVGLYRLILYVTNPAGVQATSAIMIRSASKQPGIQNVAVGVPVYLNFIEATPGFNFGKPITSTARLFTTVATPPTTVLMFTPDVAGVYDVTETTSGNVFTIVAGTWSGAYGPDGIFGHGTINGKQCTDCHNDSIAPDKFPSVYNTKHATMFVNGINGLLGDGTVGPSGYEPIDAPPYDSAPIDHTTNEVCLSCHTVGYDQAPVANGTHNNGFNDVMKTFGWAFPGALQTSNWASMLGQYPAVATLGNIQCDSCHGPSNSFAHGPAPDQLVERVGWNAGVCAQCHDGQGPDWTVSSHAYLALSISEATVQNRGSFAAHCGRCHSAQGFNEYLDEVSSGVNNGTQNLALNITGLTNIGLTVSQVQPQTCQACHDPHDASNPKQLRIYGNTFTLAGGFTGVSVGAGAVCMECHNTRNGLHNESVAVANYTAPHTPSQADVLMGQNSYFAGITGTTTIYVSKHANIADTCVTCHMADNPNNPGGAPSSHVWTINPQDKGALCQKCHGVGTTGDGLQTEVEGLLARLDTQIGKYLAAGIAASASTSNVWINSYNPVTDASSPVLLVPAASGIQITSASVYEIHGQEGFLMWITGTTYYSQFGSITTTTGPVFALNGSNPIAPVLVKAAWNYSLVEGDGSLGIHNPTYILTILDNTLTQLP